MANYVRKLVSGNKARFRDEELDLELDLVYVTDHIIIMGYPAEGLEGYYRNRREDAKKFLDHRHGNNYWIFNFCPLTENSYDASFFAGRVSRYPFPDHHAPPLAILPLAAREIRTWLEGSSDRVAVLHCKAGKGRSGTLACAYLLSQDIAPEPPKLKRSYTAKQWAKRRAEEWMDVVETDDMQREEDNSDNGSKPEITSEPSSVSKTSDGELKQEKAIPMAVVTDSNQSRPTPTSTLESVLNLHTSRRMKQPSASPSRSTSPSKKPKQGVSIPSQRRFLLYWSLVLSRTAPDHFWPLKSPSPNTPRPKVRLLKVTLRLRDPGNAKMTIIRTINKVLEQTTTSKGEKKVYGQAMGNVWVSLARYDDEFVGKLEDWERHTRDESDFGKRKKGSDHQEEGSISEFFEDGKWDKGKMVRSFAKLGRTEKKIVVEDEVEKTRIYTHILTPLDQSKWSIVKKSIEENPTPAVDEIPAAMKEENDTASFNDSDEQVTIPEEGIVVDAAREVRVKLYMGQVFLGWIWFIPTFHMPQPPPQTGAEIPPLDIDFPVGIGSWIVDLDIEMQWLPLASAAVPPARQTSKDSAEGEIAEPVPGGILAGVGDMAAGSTVASAVEAVQAARD
ncbi:hypothetical protein M422DRAFT_57516 [Sphaerobolus stellatus SS14]|nr:hypothetical protein M422DRAFT_57516 [Sphaerobolus stellatus SS14]